MAKAIVFDHVGKQYRLGRVGTGTLSHDLNRFWQTKVLRREDPYLKIGECNDRTSKGASDYVWALRDISFSVEQGEVVGIIGRNGAGKSTLLKLLSNITAPTTGKITYQGRVASLLEVGTGFHQEMTGRENIYMNGAILGMTRQEITQKLDAIVDFAGVERYLDTPVKRYSSGMTVRLGFAVAAFLEPDILVVDEVLAVGDAEFQKKAIGKIRDVSEGEGRTVLFVSHNMGAVTNLCTRGIVLDQGHLMYDGDVNDAIKNYNSICSLSSHFGKISDHLTWMADHIQLRRVLVNGNESDHQVIQHNQSILEIVVEGETSTDFDCNFNLHFRSIEGVPLATYAPGAYRGILQHVQAGHFLIQDTVQLPAFLSAGDVVVDVWIHQPQYADFVKLNRCCYLSLEGNFNSFCIPLHIKDDGLLGL